MRCIRGAGLLVCSLVLGFVASGCVAGGHVAGAPVSHAMARAADVDVYASVPLGSGWQCDVGAVLHGNVLREQPVVSVVGPTGAVRWRTRLPLPAHFYQGRATHCVASPGSVYVLVQLDTSAQQSMNETVLRVVRLSRRTGVHETTHEVDVPHVTADYTSWVAKGADHFQLRGGKLVIKGEYALMSNRTQSQGRGAIPFVVDWSVFVG